MIEVEHIDYGVLKIVKGEIDVNLLQAHEKLNAFRKNTGDTTQMASCITLLHQVYGALQALDITWVSVFAGTMERVAHVISEDPSRRTEWVYHTLASSFNELPAYLEKLQGGENTPPLQFLSFLNDLRVACGDSLLSEAMIFTPQNVLPIVTPLHSGNKNNNNSDVRALAGRLLPMYQTGLLVWYRDAHNKVALRRLMEVMIQLQQASPNEGLWYAAGEVIERLLEGSIESGTSIKLLLGQVERQIRRVMDVGCEHLLHNPPADLLKNLLYYAELAENCANPGAEDRSSDVHPDGAKSMLLEMATKTVKDDLAWVKKTFDEFSRSNRKHTADELRTIMDILCRVSGMLDMLGRWELRQRVRKQAGILDSMLVGESILGDPRIMEVSNTLLYVESLLGDTKVSAKSALKRSAKNPEDNLGRALQAHEDEHHELSRAVIREVMVDLTQVKDDIIAFTKEATQYELLNPVPNLLHRIIGSLTMLSLRRPATVLKAVYHYITHEMLGVRINPTQATLDTLADVLTSVEYYLESMVESQMNLNSLLDMAEGNITTLGYFLDRVDEMVIDAGASTPAYYRHCESDGYSEEQGEIIDEEIEMLPAADVAFNVEEIVDVKMDDSQVIQVSDKSVHAEPSKKDEIVVDDKNEEITDEIIEIFVEEAVEALDSINKYCPRLKNLINDDESLKIVRRSFHTLKGSGRLVGANVIGELSWSVESLLNKIISGESHMSPGVFDLMEKVLLIMPGLIHKFQADKKRADIGADIQALMAEAQTLMRVPYELIAPVKPAEVPVCALDNETIELLPIAEDAKIALEELQVIDIVLADEPMVAQPADVVEEAPAVDPVLLDIFKNESEGRLKEIRDFIASCRTTNKSYVTEPLARNLHTLQGSAHMAGFMEIAKISEQFEHHVDLVSQQQRGMIAEELLALESFIELMNTLLYLHYPCDDVPEVAVAMKNHAELMRRMKDIVDHYEKDNVLPETMPEIMPVIAAINGDPDHEHDEIIVKVFLEEATEILANTELALQHWMNEPDIMGSMAHLERELHTLKGGARMAGIIPMGDLSHSVESLLNAIVSGKIQVTDDIHQVLQRSHDHLHEMLEQAIRHETVSLDEKLIVRLETLAGNRAEGAVSADITDIPPQGQTSDHAVDIPLMAEPLEIPAADEPNAIFIESDPLPVTPAIEPEPMMEPSRPAGRTANEQIRVKADLLDHLVNQAGELSISRSRLEQQVAGLRSGLNEMRQTITRLRDQVRKLDIETEAQILFRYQEVSAMGEDFDPLEFDRFSLVQQLSRSMMESASDLVSIQSQLDKQTGDSETLLLQQARLNTELQENMMSTRLLPFSGIASRLRRLARQISREIDKAIDLDVIGEDAEVDRTVLDRIVGPLEHMVRNAIDHGIEDLETRRKSGKPDKGKITISLAKEGTEMVLRIKDDGRGLNFQAIRHKAIEHGLMAKNSVIDDQTLTQFVLEPGFSTAEKVTQISGRGVGMDVVNNEIRQLGGSLNIESKAGVGSTFTVRLPVALSVTRALIVKEFEQIYAIPNSSIDGVMRVDHAALMKAYDSKTPTFEYGNEHYQLQSLHDLLRGGVSPAPSFRLRHLLLMVHGSGQRAALYVDSFIESREVVVKSLGLQLSSVRGIMGATIMGDGSVVLILDIPILLRLGMIAGQVQEHESAFSNRPFESVPVVDDKVLTAMVVDDSITVRKVTSRLLERNHMRVLTAKDGVDAVEILQHHIPDVMLLDVEMPRMDGFELASVIRNDERLKHIPIIMITSRTGEKHRDHAMRIGVNKYLGKPYQEDDLLGSIRTLTSGYDDYEIKSMAV